MKIIKNLKYFLMLGCVSFATFTFAETTTNQDADKKAVQRQLSKKLNDLSIHIETLENMLKSINVNDWNDMKNILDGFEIRIDDLDSKIAELPENLENMFCTGTPDLMNGYVIESGTKLATYQLVNVNGSYGEEKDTVVNYRKWSNGYLEQFAKIETPTGGKTIITLPIAYPNTTNMYVLVTRNGYFNHTADAGLAGYATATNKIEILQGEEARDCTFYVFGYIDVNAELEKPHRHMHGYVVDAGIIEQDHDGDPNTDPRKVMYRKWNDGWLEQHGVFKTVRGENPPPIMFPYKYKDRELMNIQLSESRHWPDSYVINISSTNITTSGFSIELDWFNDNFGGTSADRYYFWKAEGYIDGSIEIKNTCDSMYRYVCDTYEYKNEETGEVKWYRKWSDGWVEQGGQTVSAVDSIVQLPIAFRDTDYTATTTVLSAENCAGVVIKSKTTTSFIISSGIHGGGHLDISTQKSWYACGYCKEE